MDVIDAGARSNSLDVDECTVLIVLSFRPI